MQNDGEQHWVDDCYRNHLPAGHAGVEDDDAEYNAGEPARAEPSDEQLAADTHSGADQPTGRPPPCGSPQAQHRINQHRPRRAVQQAAQQRPVEYHPLGWLSYRL